MLPVVRVETHQPVPLVELVGDFSAEKPLMVVVGRYRAIGPERSENIGEVLAQPSRSVEPELVAQYPAPQFTALVRPLFDIPSGRDALGGQPAVDVVAFETLLRP